MADGTERSSIVGGPCEGTTFSYIPGPTLNMARSLTLHREWTDKIDPITYEVIRHNLWNINEELGMTIQRISGSPVAMYAFDLNSSIFTEDGEFIYYGPYQLYMSGVSDVQVKWTLEHRSKNPGIHEDDMFLSNDPWVGAAHQMDVTLLTPVFHEGKLFCWITNVLHQYDVGGITPGSFCPSARDSFDEGILIPPIKIVERGELRKDIEGVYLRASLMTAINELLCWDQLYAIGGALRHIEFQPALGCFTSATHPASVSTAPVQAMEISLYPAYNTISKMLSCDPELKKDVMTIGGTSQFPLTVFRGIDQWGEKFGYLLLDPMVGAIGAFSFRHGIATGGQVRSPICRIGNVEHNEQSFPLLMIHRKENM